MIVAREAGAIEANAASVVTVGTFDGVHLGHRAIIRRLKNAAYERGARSVVLTFDPHPRSVVGPKREQPDLLTSVEERVALFEQLGVDLMVVIPFTLEFSRQSAEDFVRTWLVKAVGVRHMVVGHDHHFGRGRQGSVEELEALGLTYGFSIEQVPAVILDGMVVSSSEIRTALNAGDVERAHALLGYRYRMAGTVVRGDRRGATLGYPTANLQPIVPEKLMPAHGVYVVEGAWEGTRRFGMMNIGVRPTVASGLQETREVHFFGHQGEMYGMTVNVEFMARLREEKRFPSLDALVRQLEDDRNASHRIIERMNEQTT